MRKIILVILLLIVVTVPVACSNEKKEGEVKKVEQIKTVSAEVDIRRIAWEQLSTEDKKRIEGTWENSKVSKVILREDMGIIKDKSYIGKEVYIIDFKTNEKRIPNNMIVYLSVDSKKLQGYGYIE